MKDILIINNTNDKQSREFVDKYKNLPNVEVIEDDGYNVRITFPYISAFPTVIIPTPEHVENYNLVPAGIEYIRSPQTFNEVQERIDYWEQRVPNWKTTDGRYIT